MKYAVMVNSGLFKPLCRLYPVVEDGEGLAYVRMGFVDHVLTLTASSFDLILEFEE